VSVDKYIRAINPTSVRERAVTIVAPYAGPGRWNWHQPAAIFDWVNENVAYVPDPIDSEYVSGPDETLRTRGGDCEDLAILIASLCEAVGIPARLVSADLPGAGHMLAEVRIGKYPLCDVQEDLAYYFRATGQGHGGALYADSDGEGALWVIADAAMANHFGDIGGLGRQGYIRDSNKSWEWTCRIEYGQPHRLSAMRDDSQPGGPRSSTRQLVVAPRVLRKPVNPPHEPPQRRSSSFRRVNNTIMDDYTLTESVELNGRCMGSLTVPSGIGLVLNGTCCDDLRVESGASADVNGTIMGDVRNHGGELRVRGVVMGDVVTTSGHTSVESGSTVMGKVRGVL